MFQSRRLASILLVGASFLSIGALGSPVCGQDSAQIARLVVEDGFEAAAKYVESKSARFTGESPGDRYWRRETTRTFDLLRRLAAADEETRRAMREVYELELRCLADPLDPATRDELIQRRIRGIEEALGSEHWLLAHVYHELGSGLVRAGRSAESVAAFDRALSITRSQLGASHPLTLMCQVGHGVAHEKARRWDAAEASAREAIAAADPTEVAPLVYWNIRLTATRLLGRVYSGQLRDEEAAAVLGTEYAHAVREYDPLHDQVWLLEKSWLDALFRVGRLEECESTLVETLQRIEEKGGLEARRADALELLSSVQRRRSRYHEAIGSLEAAMAIREQLFGERHRWLVGNLTDLGALQRDVSDFEAAERSLRLGLELARSGPLANESRATQCALNLSVVLFVTGQNREAEVVARWVLDRLQPNGDSAEDWIYAADQLSCVLARSGQHAEAYRLALRCLEIAKDSFSGSLIEAKCAMNVAAFLHTSDPHRARSIYAEVLEAYQRLGGQPLIIAGVKKQLSKVLDRVGDREEATRLRKEAESTARQLGSWEVVHDCLDLEGVQRYIRGDFAGSEACSREALGIAKKHRLQLGLVARDHLALGSCTFRQGRYAEAAEHYALAARTWEEQRTEVLGDERLRVTSQMSKDLRDACLRLASARHYLGEFGAAVTALERGRNRALLDLLARDRRDLLAEARRARSPEEAAALDRLVSGHDRARRRITSIEHRMRNAAQSGSELRAEELDRRSQELERARFDAAAARARVWAEFDGLFADAKPLSCEAIQKGLDRDELLITLGSTYRFLLTFTVPGQGKRRGRVPRNEVVEPKADVLGHAAAGDQATADAFAERAAHLRASLAAGRWGEAEEAAAEWIGSRLFSRQQLDQIRRAGRVIIVADGPLQGLPFAILRVDGDRPFAGRALTYASSGTLYLDARNKARSALHIGSPRLVALGDPAYSRPDDRSADDSSDSDDSDETKGSKDTEGSGLPPEAVAARGDGTDSTAGDATDRTTLEQLRLYGGELAALPGTRREVESIRALFDRANGTHRLFCGSDATLTALEAAAPKARYLHLATHGFLGNYLRPFDASLALAAPPSDSAAGSFLTLDRLLDAWRGRLPMCELVVLSACNTQSVVQRGDSALALPWGFLFAGARSVVGSLWKIDDLATSLFMRRFYEVLLGLHDTVVTVDGSTFEPGARLPKDLALVEAARWLRELTVPEARAVLGLSEEEWSELASRLRGRARVEEAAVPSTEVAARPFASPYYWAAFVLVGSGE